MAEVELRCGHNLHGVLVDGSVLEVKCRNRRCGSRPGVVVLHRFDLRAGDLVDTRLFRDPIKEEVKGNGTPKQHAAVRSA